MLRRLASGAIGAQKVSRSQRGNCLDKGEAFGTKSRECALACTNCCFRATHRTWNN
jgi:hypothetical protein